MSENSVTKPSTSSTELDESASSSNTRYLMFDETEGRVKKGQSGKMNFSMEVIGESKPGAAYPFLVMNVKYKRLTKDGVQLHNTRCQMSIEKFMCVNDFIRYLKMVTGFNILCTLSMGDIRSYIDEKYDDYFTAGKPEFFSCANYIGIQEDGSLVLNDKIQINDQGIPISSKQMFMLSEECTALIDKYSFKLNIGEIGPGESIPKLFKNLKVMFRHNYAAMVGTLASYSYLLTYPNEVRMKKGVPAIMLYSPECATGKSTAINVAASLHGQPHSVLSKISDAALKKRANFCGIPTILDDVNITKELQKKVIDFYTGCGEADVKAQYTVNSGMLLTSNNPLPTDSERVTTKVLIIGFQLPVITPNTEQQLEAFRSLNGLVQQACPEYLYHVVKMVNRYGKLTVEEKLNLQKKAKELLDREIHPRIVDGYGNLLFFIQQIVAIIDDDDFTADGILEELCMSISSLLCTKHNKEDIVEFCVELQHINYEERLTFMRVGEKGLCFYLLTMPTRLLQKFKSIKQKYGTTKSNRKFQDVKTKKLEPRSCHCLGKELLPEDYQERLAEKPLAPQENQEKLDESTSVVREMIDSPETINDESLNTDKERSDDTGCINTNIGENLEEHTEKSDNPRTKKPARKKQLRTRDVVIESPKKKKCNPK